MKRSKVTYIESCPQRLLVPPTKPEGALYPQRILLYFSPPSSSHLNQTVSGPGGSSRLCLGAL